VFDVPSEFLSRIVGLDFDLLIPVSGHLSYEMKEGVLRLTKLTDSFSENRRSEFFLLHGADFPTIDPAARLNIVIEMKQFVLFKLTESFVISIDGTLFDPQFHLKKKKWFFN
jgi:hypothetical protein